MAARCRHLQWGGARWTRTRSSSTSPTRSLESRSNGRATAPARATPSSSPPPSATLTQHTVCPSPPSSLKDYGEFDNLSQLDRPGVFRLNIGVSRETFQILFGYLPGKKSAENTEYDYAALDTLMPHPLYAPQSFVCVLNPSPETFETVKPLLAEAWSIVETRYSKQRSDQE